MTSVSGAHRAAGGPGWAWSDSCAAASSGSGAGTARAQRSSRRPAWSSPSRRAHPRPAHRTRRHPAAAVSLRPPTRRVREPAGASGRPHAPRCRQRARGGERPRRRPARCRGTPPRRPPGRGRLGRHARPSTRAGTAWPRSWTPSPSRAGRPMTGYDREQFGQAWADTDRNGCDTRNDILRRDLPAATLKAGTHGCVVAQRHAARPVHRRGRSRFVRGAATSRACRSTTSSRSATPGRRAPSSGDADARPRFANDPLNLLAVDGAANQQQGRRGRGDLAAAEQVVPLRLRRAAGRGEGAVRAVGHRRRAGRRTTGAGRLPRASGCLSWPPRSPWAVAVQPRPRPGR